MMKKILLAIMLLSATSVAMAAGTTTDPLYGGIYDGYSNLTYSSQGFAQGNEMNTQGGFCSVTSTAGCTGVAPAPGTFTTGINPVIPASSVGMIEAGSGSGMNIGGTLSQIAAPAGGTQYNAGTYNYLQAATSGGYTVSGLTDPGSQGIANAL